MRDINNRYPILNIADVKPYLHNLATYQLPLSTAYPIFSWRVLFRGGHFVGILHSDDDYPILPVTRFSVAALTSGISSKRIRPSANCVLTRMTRLYSMICKPIT